jgi:hypothetical protein
MQLDGSPARVAFQDGRNWHIQHLLRQEILSIRDLMNTFVRG